MLSLDAASATIPLLGTSVVNFCGAGANLQVAEITSGPVLELGDDSSSLFFLTCFYPLPFPLFVTFFVVVRQFGLYYLTSRKETSILPKSTSLAVYPVGTEPPAAGSFSGGSLEIMQVPSSCSFLRWRVFSLPVCLTFSVVYVISQLGVCGCSLSQAGHGLCENLVSVATAGSPAALLPFCVPLPPAITRSCGRSLLTSVAACSGFVVAHI